MKQRTIIHLLMKDDKTRSKAMKIAVAAQGVTSVAIKGGDKDMLVVIGNGVDAVNLTKSLRDKVGYASIVSVHQLDGTRYQQEHQLDGTRYRQEQEYGMTYAPSYTNSYKTNHPTTDYYGYDQPPHNFGTYQVVYDHDSPGCSIM